MRLARLVPLTLPLIALAGGCATTGSDGSAEQAGYQPPPVAAGPGASNGARVDLPMDAAINQLRVAPPVTSGYEREKFVHWVDADHDCQDTRTEVLIEESTVKATGKCTVTGGHWVSAYDGEQTTSPHAFDIDHFVPLGEAWASGADKWDPHEREAYANDLGDPRDLVAVTAASNRSKGDQDPAHWLPPKESFRCNYTADWVAVKTRWSLAIDTAEKKTLLQYAAKCGNPRIKIARADVAAPTTTPSAATPSTSAPSTGSGSSNGSGTSGKTDPRFDTCTDAEAKGYGPYKKGTDPEYAWYRDADGDGSVCDG